MNDLANDLFLLMAGLSQLKSKDRILLLFTNAINSLLKEVNVFYSDEQKEDHELTLEICTSQYSFGYFHLETDTGNILDESYVLLQNAVQMLAVILEKNEHEKLLQDDKRFLNKIVRERTIELQRNQEAFKTLTENSPDITLRFDKKLRHLYASQNVKDLYGIEASDFIRKTNRELGFTEKLCTYWESEIRKVFRSGVSSLNIFPFESRGGKIILEWRLIPEFDSQGHVNTVLSISRDVTEQKKFEEELKNAKERAEESDRLKTAFLSNLSHEIRTPMNGILGFSRLLDRDDLPTVKRKQYINIIDSSIKSLLKIISDIIEISKLESEKTMLYKEKCNLNILCKELYNEYENRKRDTIEFIMKLDFEDGEDVVIVDSRRLTQVLMNVLDNAFKFTTKGKVVFGYKSNNDGILFFVSDTGTGIKPGNSEKIFERFQQEDNSRTRKYGGTGLGLTISKKLIELMDGKIWFRSEINTGSTFYINLPLFTRKRRIKSVGQMKNMIDYNWKNKKIMVVEDDETSIELIQEMFSETNVSIIVKQNGTDAVDFFRGNNSINLVLMDIQLPKMNGLEATKEIRKISEDIPIIAQTAYAFESDRIKALEAGCNDYIAKPFDKDQLFAKVDKYLH